MASEPIHPDAQDAETSSSGRAPGVGGVRDRRAGRLVPLALAAGLLAMLVATVALVMLYEATRDRAEAALAARNLEIARYIAHFVDERGGDGGLQAGASALREVWGSLRAPSEPRFMCFVDSAGVILVHTATPERVGSDARGLRLVPTRGVWPTNIGDLVEARADWTGTMISEEGERRISAFAYSHELGGHVNIHAPEQVVRASVASTTAPVAFALGVVVFALIPLSAGILLTAYHSSRRETESARSTLRGERSEAERRLGQLELFFQNPSVGFALVDRDLRYVRVNAALAAINGRSPAEHAGRTLREVVPELADAFEPLYRAVIETGEMIVGREVRGASPTDHRRERVWLANFHPLRDEAGGVVAVACAVYDVTDLRLTERALHDTEQRYRAIVETAQEGVWVLDRDDRTSYVNPRMAQLLGRPADEVVGESIFDILSPDRRESTAQELERRRQGQSEVVSLDIRRPDGSVIETICVTNPLLDSAGGYAGAVAMVTDVTERNRAARALTESERRLAQAQRIGGLGSWHWDMRSNVITWSDELARIFGVAPGDMPIAYEHFLEHVHPEDRDRVDVEVKRAARDRCGASYDFRIVHRDGGIRHLSTTQEITLDERGEPVEMMGATIDMTDRQRAERQRIARNRVLEKLAAGAMLEEVLRTLTLAVEEVSPDLLCSVLLVDGGRLRHAAAPSLPDFYNEAIDGIEIGPTVGSCGAAAALGQRVVVEDIGTHPNWAIARDLAAAAGLGACWSEPIFSSTGEILGTFAIYYRSPRSPGEADLEFIASTAQLASIAIERTRDARALRESEERFRVAMDAASMGMWTIDLDTQMVDCSGDLLEMFGVPEGVRDLRLDHFLDRIHGEDLPDVEAAIRRTIEDDALYDCDFRTVHLNGEVRWLSGRGRVYRGPDGKAERFAGVTWDATDLVIAQRSLRESENRLRQVLEATADAIWDWDVESDTIFWSDRFFELLGLTPGAVAPNFEYAMGITHPDDAPVLREALRRHFDEGEPYRAEVRLRHSDGRWIWTESRGRAVRDDNGRVVRMVGSLSDITQRRLAEDALRESERRFAVFMRNTPAVTWMKDDQGRYVFVNESLTREYQRSESEIIGKTDFEVLPEGVARELRANDQTVLERWETLETEEVIPSPGGRLRTWHIIKFPLLDGAGRRLVAGFAFDMTQQKQAEGMLRLSEERFRTALKNSPLVVFNQDTDLRYTWVHNPHGAPAFEGILDKRDADLDPLRRLDESLVELKRSVLETGEGARREVRVRVGEQDFVYDLTTEPMLDEKGRIVGITGAAMDITALRAAHDALEDRVLERTQELVVTNWALRNSEERFRSIFENTGVGVVLTSSDGRPVQVNPAFLQMMGHDAAPANGLPDDLMRSSDAIGDAALFRALAAGQRDSYQVERRAKRRDGQELWLRITAQAIHSPSGNFEAAVVIIENVTERKLAEETAQRRQNELAHASRFITVGELAAGLAHELNQPLAAIASYADACSRRLASPGDDPGEPRELLGKISGQARRAGHIIHRLKDLVRKQEPRRSRFSLHEMLGETLELVEGAARNAQVEILPDLPDHLPDVDGDPIQIQQVVLNLLANAIEVMPPPAASNGAPRRVWLRAGRSEGDRVLISVEDTGPGFDDQHQERMFEPFHSTKPTGMGLGLTISRSIIEAHGGRLWAERGERVGARFCFHLPVADRKAEHDG